MIYFHYETDFSLSKPSLYESWVSSVIMSEDYEVGEVNYIFCDDDYLYEINVNHLNHNTLTDIISFDYSKDGDISGDIFISVDRVRENAEIYQMTFEEELLRVMAHGLLHYCGYADKGVEASTLMRKKEEEKMKMFHVKQF